MKLKTLIKNGIKYTGQFVATSTFNDKTVIAHGPDPQEVIMQAKQKSDSPVVFFIPEKDATHLY